MQNITSQGLSKVRIMDKRLYKQRFKDARQRKNLTQYKLGLKLEIPPEKASAYVSRYENASRIPKPEILNRICEILEISPSYLFEPDEDLAKLIFILHGLDKEKKQDLIQQIQENSDSNESK